ncbi:hypothetical protein N7447_005825 [Penicillium robsamsonii]|uniref:uncharacterized protein n=1 Tax=Penicillium robsamsonii TaxID=1792511 RepID=UPI002548F10A|nr:uncharacterized protein N7447_005825 [Penicillium robsamsonii]KAJ5823485.1 hypothetical protein N7447_005825 [Penicillium robsamsonii]
MEECTSTVSAAAVGLSIGFGEAAQSMAGKKVGIFFGYPETKNRMEWRIIPKLSNISMFSMTSFGHHPTAGPLLLQLATSRYYLHLHFAHVY